MSLSKNTKNTSTTRGAQHTPTEARKLALRLGALIENSERDERGRIKFNPIHAAMEEGLGAPCRLDRYVSSNRGTLFQKLCKYYSRSEEDLYMAKPRNGTWVIPQLAVLIVCYFWTEFQVHAADVYHRYITRDVSLAIEVGENVGATTLTVQDLDDVVSRRLEELVPKIIGQLAQTIPNNGGQILELVRASQNRMEAAIFASFAAHPERAGQVENLNCAYQHLARRIDTVDVSGVHDLDFRAEYTGFIHALADVFYCSLNKRAHVDTADFIHAVLDVTVEFVNIPRRWSSLSVRTLLQACIRMRVREWMCTARGVDYPNQQVAREIRHSTYLDLHCYFSLACHVRRVWDELGYDGGFELANMVECMVGKFGNDVKCYDLNQELFYTYGARPAARLRHDTVPIGQDQRRIDDFFVGQPHGVHRRDNDNDAEYSHINQRRRV